MKAAPGDIVTYSLVALAGLLSLSLSVVAQPSVSVSSGRLQGTTESGISSFKGIPYAAPPVGALRWRATAPTASWTGTLQATSFGNACLQPLSKGPEDAGDPGPQAEDCLYLNVWTPNPSTSQALPVLVWIHGGAYVQGSGSLPFYDGGPLARRGAVVVTFNYRLGALGFFAHPALSSEQPNGPSNFGLLDQIAVLRWVRDNIRQFGGDASNVTIAGQSAGGKSVLALFAAPLARGLFQRGFAMSSPGIPDTTHTRELEQGAMVATALGLPGAKATMAQLRAIPAQNFVRVPLKLYSIVPITPDSVLPRSLLDTFAAGAEAPVPLILGNTSDDGSVARGLGVDPVEVVRKLGAAGILLRVLYPGVRDTGELARQTTRDLIFTLPVRSIADRHARLAPTRRYYFDYIPASRRNTNPAGVPHGGEIVYFLSTGDVSPTTRAGLTDQDRQLSQQASDYLLSFAQTGNPKARNAPVWPKSTAHMDSTLIFSQQTSVQMNFMRPRLNAMLRTLKLLGPWLARRSAS